jgi:tetratricopeptide (TPR) repeat protein
LNQIAQQFQMAKQAYARGEYAQAIKICDQLAKHVGARDDLLNVKAVSLLSLDQVEAAEKTIRAALKLNPNISGMHLNAARIYKALPQPKLFKRHVMDAVRLAPREAHILYQAALLLLDCSDYSQALRVIDRYLQLQPGSSLGWAIKGSALIDLGKPEEAQPLLEKAVELDPGNVATLSTLVKIRGDRLTNSKSVALLKHIRSNGKSNKDRGIASFALANMFHRDGQYDAAFRLYLEANRLVATRKAFDLDAWEQKQIHVLQVSSEAHALTSSRGSSGANLVFIVGMPRSGTTLCEQVLSMSPSILACGELDTMHYIESGLMRRKLDPYRANLPKKVLEQAADTYLSALPNKHHELEYFTDKAPMNFERIGLIHLLFPHARFLYCIRHPLDTILSCFMQNFQAGMKFSLDLEHITKVYIAHAHLMKHWMKLLPRQIHIVNYEQYIANQEEETRNMTGFLRLDFEQSMLTPHLQQRVVATVSNLQVREPVYSSSIGRWKNYQTQLANVSILLQRADLLDSEFNSLL